MNIKSKKLKMKLCNKKIMNLNKINKIQKNNMKKKFRIFMNIIKKKLRNYKKISINYKKIKILNKEKI